MKQLATIKKGTSLLLVLTMMLVLFSGCNSDHGADTTDTVVVVGEEEVTITMLYDENPAYPYKEDWLVITALKEQMNVNLELQLVPTSDFAERRTVVFNSGEMPDIIAKTFGNDISAYIDAGLFLPISDYVDQMPNYKAFIDAYDYHADLDDAREKNGKYYMLPVNSNTQRINSHGWIMRLDQLEEIGKTDPPKTMEEVYEYCKLWKDLYPDSYPMTNRFGAANIMFKVAPAYGTIAGWGMGNMFKYQADADNFEFAPTSEGYKEMLMWFNKMYAEGLLDVEFATLDSTVYEERAKNGEQFIMVDWIGNEIRYNADGPEQSGDADFNMQPIMPPVGPWGDYSGAEVPKFEQGWVINAEIAEREDFAHVLATIDWFYSEESAELLSFGIEGETFEVLEDGRKEFMDLEFNYSQEYGIHNNCLTPRRDADLFASNKSDYVINLFTEMNDAGVFVPKQPGIPLTEDEKEMEALYKPTLADYVNTMTEKFIYGEVSFDQWDKYVEECEAKGRPELYDLYNKAYENLK